MTGEMANPPGWLSPAYLLLQALLPIVMVLTGVRALLTRPFIQLEYSLPGFPADPYGFSQADRLRLAPIALDYLLNDSGIEFLGDLNLEDGAPMYNARELRHMQDVKQVTGIALQVWRWGMLVAVGLSALIWLTAGAQTLGQALGGSAKATLVLMAVLLLGLTLAFSLLFVGFHQVFFESGTWVFSYSDTLIRLFPERFWQVAFAAIGLGTAAQAGLLFWVSRLLQR